MVGGGGGGVLRKEDEKGTKIRLNYLQSRYKTFLPDRIVLNVIIRTIFFSSVLFLSRQWDTAEQYFK